MKQAKLTVPEAMFMAGTRVALGAGLALLVADTLEEKQRRAVGWGLFLLGAATTIPIARNLLGKLEHPSPHG